MTTKEEDENDLCSICLNSLLGGQELAVPDVCKHCFCALCLREWAKVTNTCPIDRLPFARLCIRNEIGGPTVLTIEAPAVEARADDEEEEEDDRTFCEVCGQATREHVLLLCDSCDNGYHIDCLTPTLPSVPTAQWFCPQCVHNGDAAVEAINDLSDLRSGSRRLPRTEGAELVRLRLRNMMEEHGDAMTSSEEENSDDDLVIDSYPRDDDAHVIGFEGEKETSRTFPAKRTTRKRRSGKKKYKRRRRRKRRGKTSSKVITRVAKTPAQRLTEKLGVSPPKPGHFLPTTSGASATTSASSIAPSLLVTGARYGPHFSDDSDDGEALTFGARAFNEPILRNIRPMRVHAHSVRALPSAKETAGGSNGKTVDNAGPSDLLDGILTGQKVTLAPGEHTKMSSDGKLTVADESLLAHQARTKARRVRKEEKAANDVRVKVREEMEREDRVRDAAREEALAKAETAREEAQATREGFECTMEETAHSSVPADPQPTIEMLAAQQILMMRAQQEEQEKAGTSVVTTSLTVEQIRQFQLQQMTAGDVSHTLGKPSNPSPFVPVEARARAQLAAAQHRLALANQHLMQVQMGGPSTMVGIPSAPSQPDVNEQLSALFEAQQQQHGMAIQHSTMPVPNHELIVHLMHQQQQRQLLTEHMSSPPRHPIMATAPPPMPRPPKPPSPPIRPLVVMPNMRFPLVPVPFMPPVHMMVQGVRHNLSTIPLPLQPPPPPPALMDDGVTAPSSTINTASMNTGASFMAATAMGPQFAASTSGAQVPKELQDLVQQFVEIKARQSEMKPIITHTSTAVRTPEFDRLSNASPDDMSIDSRHRAKVDAYMKGEGDEHKLNKFNYRVRVEDEVKAVLKPMYSKKKIDKVQYKMVMKKCVPAICKKGGSLNPSKIRAFVEKYVAKVVSK